MSDCDLVKRLREGSGNYSYVMRVAHEAADRIEALAARVAKLEEALRPFAEIGAIMLPSDEFDNDNPWVTSPDNTQIAGRPDLLFGHFREAARTMPDALGEAS